MPLAAYTELMNALAIELTNVATAAGLATPALAGVNAQVGAETPYALAMAEKDEKYAIYDGYNYEEVARRMDNRPDDSAEQFLARAEEEAANHWATAEGQEELRHRFAMTLHMQQAQEDRRLAEQTAKQAAADFERAAKASADAFKSALEAVPGLFSSSEVTAEDMELAKAGMYEEKPDEYLRQLADEVRNGKDYAGVDIRDAAARLGIDPNLDPNAILARFTQAWNDSSLFAGGANLDLINKDAVEGALARQEASKSGKEAILKFFGLEEGDVEAAGAEARTQFVSGFTGPAAGAEGAEGGEQADFLKPILDGMDTGLQAGDAADRLYGIGGAIVGRIYAGFSDAANNLTWGQPILDSIAASVAPQVYDMLAAELPQ